MFCGAEPGPKMVGYFCCVHVAEEGAPIAHIVEPSGPGPRRAGELFCRSCIRDADAGVAFEPDDLRIVCAYCARRDLLGIVIQ